MFFKCFVFMVLLTATCATEVASAEDLEMKFNSTWCIENFSDDSLEFSRCSSCYGYTEYSCIRYFSVELVKMVRMLSASEIVCSFCVELVHQLFVVATEKVKVIFPLKLLFLTPQ